MIKSFVDHFGIGKLFGADLASGTGQAGHDDTASKLKTFFQLAAAVPLTIAEQHTLLDVTGADLTALRNEMAPAQRFHGPKLVRRLDYAIGLLHRMLACPAP
jgi:hypothetical protein